ncbi:MAG TPA: hypothetical protein PLL30_12735 [Candidatus Krumholzibacteria bacterium]|nr:hypothetical protein [Candidatus Krumholzibacteria bacterium]HPD72635.1 hypothetical protein [Candidatus Krumholzibacteria bacterium]HRY40433.1 hypothetical protein [Candidatus Krumholzibacteria bacterium]
MPDRLYTHGLRSGLVLLALILAGGATEQVAADPPPTGSFAFSFAADLPGSPDAMYDALTGDISGWWDHTMSGAPLALVIEPRPGGRFLETFDDSGDGVVHATVTYARRGEKLQMVGPLGLAGHAIHMVTTWELAPLDGGRSRLTVTVHASGEIHPGWDQVVEATWHHFIDERFVPWVTAGEPGTKR